MQNNVLKYWEKSVSIKKWKLKQSIMRVRGSMTEERDDERIAIVN